jgi:hypothetical protein
LEDVLPLVFGLLRRYDCGSAFVAALIDRMDARNGSYTAWVWAVCGNSLDL